MTEILKQLSDLYEFNRRLENCLLKKKDSPTNRRVIDAAKLPGRRSKPG
jgi:hypothetical protein